MRLIRIPLPVLFSFFVAFVTTLSGAEPRALFNPSNLDGWEIWVDKGGEKTDPASLFQIENGIVRAYPTQPAGSAQPFAGLVTRKSYSRYILRLEYRWGPGRFAPRDKAVPDSGILFHVDDSGQIWPASVECQIQQGDTGDVWTIGTRTTVLTGRDSHAYSEKGEAVSRGGKDQRYARFPRTNCWETPEWNSVEVTVDGSKAVFRVNGHVVNAIANMERWNAATGAYEPLTSGRILLQAEGAEIFFRNVTLQEL